jgi:Holliday junction resolvasome RuvABC DNA-binding subunit
MDGQIATYPHTISMDRLNVSIPSALKSWIGHRVVTGRATRIVNELKDKVGALAGLGGGAKLAAAGAGGGHVHDAVSALANLGFKPGEAQSAVALAVEELGADASLDALVRLALKRAVR